MTNAISTSRRPEFIALLSAAGCALLLALSACGGGTVTILQGGTPGATSPATTTATATGTATVQPTATPDPSRYDGTWVDNVAGSTGAGELIITNTGATASVHAYGICGTKCDWGSSSSTVGPYSLVATYSFGSPETVTLTIQLSSNNIKVVNADTHYGTSTYYMHQALPVEQRAFLYGGAWYNNDPHTNGIPELVISVITDQLTVHGYGACTPTYCDWKTRMGIYSADPFQIVFDNINGSGITHSLSLSLLDPAGDSLQCVVDGTTTYTFHKGVLV